MLNSIDIENIVILVGDAVRWDSTQERLPEYGPTFKTVAASLHTPTSFTTMLSGQQPMEHGVLGFHQRFQNGHHLFEVPDHNTAWNTGEVSGWLSTKQAIFGQQPQRKLSKMEPPFVWIDRDFGGHAPYNRYSSDGTPTTEDGRSYNDITSQEYLDLYAGDTERLQSDYEKGIDAFFDRVDDYLHELEQRGIADETLVVITSDHGELLGEYGQVGHDYPATPEIVYVPTTFIHPELDGRLVTDGVMRHIDLLPTVYDAANIDPLVSFPGVSLFSDSLPERGVTYYNRSISDYLFRLLHDSVGRGDLAEHLPDMRFELNSVWDKNGGYVFNESQWMARNLFYLFRVFMLGQGKHIRRTRSYRTAYQSLCETESVYGSPDFSQSEARMNLEQMPTTEETKMDHDYSEDRMEQLRDLGYM